MSIMSRFVDRLAGESASRKVSRDTSVSRTRRVVLIASLLCFTFSLCFALTQPNLTRTHVSWQPSTSSQSGVFQLIRGWPESITATTDCARLSDVPAEVVLDAGSLLLYVRGGELFLSIQGVDTAISQRLPNGPCQVQAGFSSLDAEAFIRIGEEERTITLARSDFPSVTRLIAGGSKAPAIDRVEIITRPTGVGGSLPRTILAILAILAAAVVVTELCRKSSYQPSQFLQRLRSLHPIDLAVLLANLVAAFTIPVHLDDGFLIDTVEASMQTGVFSTLFGDVWYPQGYLHMLVLKELRFLSLDFVHLRIVIALLLTLAWIILRTFVLSRLGDSVNNRHLLWPSGAVFVAFCGAWLMTLRSEPFVVLLIVMLWALLMSFFKRRSPLVLLAGTALAGAAIATHQTGWTALGPLLVMLALALQESRRISTSLVTYIGAVITGGAVAVLLLFISFDLGTLVYNAADFAKGSHGNSIFDEVSRYSSLFSAYFGNAARLFSVAFLMLILFVSAFIHARLDRVQQLFWIASAISIAGLALTSSKWPWHFGVYAVPAAVLTALVMAAVPGRGRGPLVSPGFHVLLPVTVLLVGMALSRSGNWGMIEGMPRGWDEFAATFGPDTHLLSWVVGLLLALVVGLFARSFGDRFRARTIATFALSSLIVLPIMLSMAWIVRNALDSDGWSLARQNLLAVANRDECGVLSDARFITSATALPTLSQRQTSTALLTEGAFPSATALAAGPLGEIPAWGSWIKEDGQATSSNPTDPSSGTFTTPAFVVGGESIAVWTATNDPSTQSAEIVFEGADGSSVETLPLSLPTDLTWQLNLVNVPQGSSLAYMRVTDRSTDSGGWTAVSSAASVVQESAPVAFASSTAFVGPMVNPAYPCLRLPTPIKGYWPRFDYVVSDNDVWNNFQFFELGLTNVGCATSYPTCVYKATYPMAEVTATTVS